MKNAIMPGEGDEEEEKEEVTRRGKGGGGGGGDEECYYGGEWEQVRCCDGGKGLKGKKGIQ